MGRAQEEPSGGQAGEPLLAGRVFPGPGVNQKLQGDKREGMLLGNQDDQLIGEDRPLNGGEARAFSAGIQNDLKKQRAMREGLKFFFIQ